MGDWALTVCMSCIMAGTLELLLPPAQSGKGIKTVLALYIILAVLNTETAADWSDFGSWQLPDLKVYDYSEWMRQLTDDECAARLEEKLEQGGLSGSVRVTEGTKGTEIFCVSTDPEKARQLLGFWLEPGTVLHCEKEDENA